MTEVGAKNATHPAVAPKPDSFLKRLLYHPRKLFVRRALFQIHLWTGLLLALYIVVIALSGAILVFETELTAALIPRTLTHIAPTQTASIPHVVDAFRSAYPGATIETLIVPSRAVPVYQIAAIGTAGRTFTVLADSAATRLVRQPRTWLNWVHDLHDSLLLGEAHGMQVNGVGGGLLLAAAFSGLVVWWPGVKQWRRGFLIGLRSRWRRMNYDAHSAIGIWTLLLVLWWAFSGLYFGWYRQVGAVVNAISPLRGMVAPQLPSEVYANTDPRRVSLETILAAAQQASPTGHLYSISNATLVQPTLSAAMDLRAWGDFSHRDLVTIDTVTGHVLSVWHYGSNHSLGDWILWAMHPIHFGTLWGLPVKILWFLLGLSLAVLSFTGVLMYWNRYLRHRMV